MEAIQPFLHYKLINEDYSINQLNTEYRGQHMLQIKPKSCYF